jgi:Domain of unknown function (DUF892)
VRVEPSTGRIVPSFCDEARFRLKYLSGQIVTEAARGSGVRWMGSGNKRTFSLFLDSNHGGGTTMGIFTKDIKTMEDLFLHQLEDIYYAEQQLTKAIPKMA